MRPPTDTTDRALNQQYGQGPEKKGKRVERETQKRKKKRRSEHNTDSSFLFSRNANQRGSYNYEGENRCNERPFDSVQRTETTESEQERESGRERQREKQTDHSHPLFRGSRASSLNASAAAQATTVAALLNFSSLNFKRGGLTAGQGRTRS